MKDPLSSSPFHFLENAKLYFQHFILGRLKLKRTREIENHVIVLKRVIISSNEISIDEDVFSQCNKLNEIKITSYEGTETIFSEKLIKSNVIQKSCGINCYYFYDKIKREIIVYGNGTLNNKDIDIFVNYFSKF